MVMIPHISPGLRAAVVPLFLIVVTTLSAEAADKSAPPAGAGAAEMPSAPASQPEAPVGVGAGTPLETKAPDQAVTPPPGRRGPQALVTIDGEPIMDSDLRQTAEAVGARGQALATNPTTRRQLLDQMVDNRLLAKAAISAGVELDPNYAELLAAARINILAQLYQKKRVARVTDEASLRRFFAAHKAEFSQKKIKASHILLKDEAEAKAVLELAKKPGADFSALAKARSKAPGAQNGGELGWFPRGRMLPEFDQVAFATKKGELAALTQSRFGWHVIKVEDVQGDDGVLYEQVAAEVKVAAEKAAREELTKEVRGKASIAVKEDALRDFRL